MEIFVGTDIESVNRFKALLSRNKLKTIFSELEYEYAINKKNPEQSFTGIWCAKEAVVKSFGQIKLINIKNVEIICTQNSQPKAIINKLDMENLEFKISVSISHTKDLATATAILVIK